MNSKKHKPRVGLFRPVLVKFQSVHDPLGFIETFDLARRSSYCGAVLVMCLEQCWATLPTTAGTGELRSRKPPANDRRYSFKVTIWRVGYFSRSDGPRSEKGRPRLATSTARRAAW